MNANIEAKLESRYGDLPADLAKDFEQLLPKDLNNHGHETRKTLSRKWDCLDSKWRFCWFAFKSREWPWCIMELMHDSEFSQIINQEETLVLVHHMIRLCLKLGDSVYLQAYSKWLMEYEDKFALGLLEDPSPPVANYLEIKIHRPCYNAIRYYLSRARHLDVMEGPITGLELRLIWALGDLNSRILKSSPITQTLECHLVRALFDLSHLESPRLNPPKDLVQTIKSVLNDLLNFKGVIEHKIYLRLIKKFLEDDKNDHALADLILYMINPESLDEATLLALAPTMHPQIISYVGQIMVSPSSIFFRFGLIILKHLEVGRHHLPQTWRALSHLFLAHQKITPNMNQMVMRYNRLIFLSGSLNFVGEIEDPPQHLLEFQQDHDIQVLWKSKNDLFSERLMQKGAIPVGQKARILNSLLMGGDMIYNNFTQINLAKLLIKLDDYHGALFMLRLAKAQGNYEAQVLCYALGYLMPQLEPYMTKFDALPNATPFDLKKPAVGLFQ